MPSLKIRELMFISYYRDFELTSTPQLDMNIAIRLTSSVGIDQPCSPFREPPFRVTPLPSAATQWLSMAPLDALTRLAAHYRISFI